MKRSDALEIIKEFLFNLPQDRAYLWKYIDSEADSLLSQLEGFSDLDYRWEPEDEG